jgi:hypothetical protein
MSYRGLLASSLAVALVAGSAAFAPGGSHAQAPQPEASPPAASARQGGAHVTVPNADVTVQAERGKVRVEAPYSSVKVDADAGQVKVRAPYVNLDVHW